MIFGSMKMIMIGVMVAGLAGAGAYVYKLKADNATLKANQIKLESAVSEQKQLIENQKKDFDSILQANKDMNKLINVLKKDFEDLDKRFNKGNRDIGKVAIEKSMVIELSLIHI